jgi:hypothetical protein
MDYRDYYQERKWCTTCNDYVRYMMSVNHSYCIHCGTSVKLFNKEDLAKFRTDLERRKWKVS